RPTAREQVYLAEIQSEFDAAVSRLAERPAFREWVTSLLLTAVPESSSQGSDATEAPPGPTVPAPPWEELLRTQPSLALAGMRFLIRLHHPTIPPLLWPAEAYQEPDWQDWIVLLERHGLDRLKPSADPEDHRELARLQKALKPFGFTLTERGMRQGRSPGDLVLSFTEAKAAATARILGEEHEALGERLRAMVVTDFERAGNGHAKVRGTLEPDAGSARHLFRYLVADGLVRRLRPVLATGQTLWVDVASGATLVEQFNAYLQAHHLDAKCHSRPTDVPAVLEVVGSGAEWSSGTYVRMVTDAFDRGACLCLVGTRGIFGEGWDSPALNTLIDLTSVTTSTAVQQLRGTTLRLDP